MKKVAEKTFTDVLIEEGSWGFHQLGKYESTMTLYKTGHGDPPYFIEWDIPELDEVYDIGIWVDGDNIVKDYDGIMSLPDQAIELLKENGFNTEEVET